MHAVISAISVEQVLVALLADCETAEWRRKDLISQSMPPENPRAR